MENSKSALNFRIKFPWESTALRWSCEVCVNTWSFFSPPLLVEYPRSISRHFPLPGVNSRIDFLWVLFVVWKWSARTEREKNVRRAAIEKLEKSQIQMLRCWKDGGGGGGGYRPGRTEPPRRTKTSNTGSRDTKNSKAPRAWAKMFTRRIYSGRVSVKFQYGRSLC